MRIRGILSVANPVRIAALQAGIARDYRMRGCLAPSGVLLELCRQIAGLQVDADVVRSVPPISRDGVLSAKERRVLDLLGRNGGLMWRASLASACREKGMNRSSFYGLLEHSPVIASYAPGVVGPVGAETPPGALERLDRSVPLDRHPRNPPPLSSREPNSSDIGPCCTASVTSAARGFFDLN